ncbi:MAG: hypothetical protein IJU28_11275 [Clostridia bacterium]|nr:hypothetical protein [Clostridia bacterium]
MSPAVEKLRQLGFDLSDSVLETIGEELHVDPNTLPFTDLLLGLGLGDYDYDTGEWTPRSSRVYAFDAEVFDIDHMYTLFLQGVQAIVPGIEITNIREDLSGMTAELELSGDPMSPPTDGKRSVAFTCNGHEYSTELDSRGDWFNEQMFLFLDQVLEKENCPLKLYEFQAQMQYVIVVYGTQELCGQLKALIQPY